jgi:addiction module RelE/StbE family toxin
VTLLYTAEARADVEQLHAYIARRQSPARAHKVASSIRVATNRLLVFPQMGRPGRVAGTRELVVPRLPYIVVYVVQGDDVIIQRVLHTSRQWPSAEDEE